MPRAAQADSLIGQLGLRAVKLQAQLRAGKDHVQMHQQRVIRVDIRAVGGAVGGQLGQDPLDLGLLPGFQLPDLVVGLHGRHRLDEKGRAGGGYVVDKTGNGVFVFGLDGHHEPVGTGGDDRVLQELGH